MRKKLIERKSFVKISSAVKIPDLLDIQLKSFREFLQDDLKPEKRKSQGLQEVFEKVFPITDSRENYILEFVEYYVDSPKYSVKECRNRGVTYSVPLKLKMRLSIKDKYSKKSDYIDTLEQVVYLGNFPYMTDKGTFIINGAERIIVNQLHRSPGVFFDEKVHPNGSRSFSARVIPFRGSWLEFSIDINDVLYVYIDQGRKFPATVLLRALGCATDEEILRLFNMVDEVSLNDKKIKENIGRHLFFDNEEVGIVDNETGELLFETGDTFDEETLTRLKELEVSKVKFYRGEEELSGVEVIKNTFIKDNIDSEKDAIEYVYHQLRSGEPPDIDTARTMI
ncbi:MAG: hypothetical protein P8078_09385 [bacterium]